MGSFTPTPLSIPSAASPPGDSTDARDSGGRDDSLQHHRNPPAAASPPLPTTSASSTATATATNAPTTTTPTTTTNPTTTSNATIHSAASSAANTTSPAFQHPQQAQHKRVYQACIPCRRRKVRCDLGSVDNPHDPPCVRCRRESKECFFSATRRKRKTDDDGDPIGAGGSGGGGGGGSDVDEYIIRNGRKKLHAADDSPGYLARFDRRQYSDVPLTPGGSQGRREPLRRPDHEGGDESLKHKGSSGNGSGGSGNGTGGKGGKQNGGAGAGAGEFDGDGDGDGNQTLENLEAQTVMRRVMYGPHDALDLLYKAATDRFVDLPADPLLPPRARGSTDGRLLDDNHSPAATHPDYHSSQNHTHHGQNHNHNHNHNHSHSHSQHHSNSHSHHHNHHHHREDSVASAASLPAASASSAAAAATSSSSLSLHTTHEQQDPRHHHSHGIHGQRPFEQQSPFLSQGGGGAVNINSNSSGNGNGNGGSGGSSSSSSNHHNNINSNNNNNNTNNYAHDSTHGNGNGNNTGSSLGIRHAPVPALAVKPEPQQPVDPTLTQADLTTQPGYEEALRAWSRFRFVRAGWFTAQEAIEYIDYYYKYLSPLTPISPPTFSNPASHLTLLTEEPILTVTLLTIASRYRQLPGTGGICRSHAIPEQLWTYLRGMIERCLWGQEAFGGGFCGSGPGSTSMLSDEAQTSSTAPWRGLRKGSLRTLGTIESLLVLTEWHPRALHFPPQEATDELVLPLAETSPLMASEDEMHRSGAPGIGGRRIESWLEPAWRSDRMCWMLLSTAMGLAYELGVFDDIDEMLKDDAITRPEYKEEVYRQRANRIKRLLLIYTSQLAGRLGWTSMTPEHLRKADPAVARQRPRNNAHDDGGGGGIGGGNGGGGGGGGGGTPLTNPSSLANGFNYVPDLELDDQIIHCWAGISNAMYLGNEKLFKTRKHTTEIIQSGKYVELLREFTPLLRDWFREFELFRLPQYIRHILTIEYEYVRIYINSLSLQAVVERCTSNAGSSNAAAAAAAGPGPTTGPAATTTTTTTTQLSPQTMINYGKLPLGQLGGFTVHDQEYVREVVDGSRNLLRTVVQGLLPGGYLKHAPVRTYFRIISGAMFLLKTFALGAPRSDVKMSIELMDATVEALRTCVVDDVHLGIRFADLLESLTSRLRNRFIQAPMQNPSAGLRSPAVEFVNGVSVPLQPGQLLQPLQQQQQQQQLQALQQQQQQQQQQQMQQHQQQQQSAANAADDGATASWVSGHAQRLRDGLNGHFRPSTPDANTISATPFDLSASAFFHGTTSLGPSTPSGAAAAGAGADNGNNNNNNNNPPGSSGGLDGTLFDDWGAAGNEMWYLPPGPAFFQNGMENGSVAMTAEGVNVGGLDLLEYMAMDPVGFPMEGGGL